MYHKILSYFVEESKTWLELAWGIKWEFIIRIEKRFQSPKDQDAAVFLEPREWLCIPFTLWFFLFIWSCLIRRSTSSVTQLLVWLGEGICPYVWVSQIILSGSGDWLTCPSPNPQGRGSEWSSLGQTFTADLIPYFQVGVLGTLYKHDSQQPISENGEFRLAVKGVILSWEYTFIRKLLHNYHVIWVSSISEVLFDR